MTRITVPTPGEPFHLDVSPGEVVVIVGANGSGKTRLGTYIEGVEAASRQGTAPAYRAHRVAARRDLAIQPIQVVPLEEAERELHFGLPHDAAQSMHAFSHRWREQPAVHQLADFPHVLKVLFAEHLREAVRFKEEHRQNPVAQQKSSKLERLVDIWHGLLPQRRLRIVETSLRVSSNGKEEAEYEAGQMSDGERVALYLIGQVLTAPTDAVLVVDEPELHVHRAILASLWDRLEGERADLAFVYLTHDLEFAASRRGARKIALLDFGKGGDPGSPGRWTLRPIPEGDGAFDEDLAVRVLGSRRPVLFVEGGAGSLDAAVWRKAHPGWSVMPLGGCEAVIHATASFNANGGLHRMRCVGVIDGDGRDDAEKTRLAGMPVHVLPVAEIENLFLLPEVFRILAHALGLRGADLERAVRGLESAVVERARTNREAAVARRVARALDRCLKGIDLAADDVGRLREGIAAVLAGLDVDRSAEAVRVELDAAIAERDVPRVLALYDDKGLLADAAQLLNMKKDVLERRILGLLADKDETAFVGAVRRHLPALTPEENATPAEASPVSEVRAA